MPNTTEAPTGKLILDTPTDEERQSALADFFAEQRKINEAGRKAVAAAVPAMQRLAEVMQGRSGQPYKVRTLLYSLYNGQPASLIEMVNLDRSIREDLCAVMLAFGFEETRFVGGVPEPGVTFFYEEMMAAIEQAGQRKWFLEAHNDEEEA